MMCYLVLVYQIEGRRPDDALPVRATPTVLLKPFEKASMATNGTLMAHWNKVSPASSYLVDIQSGVDKGLVRVWFVRSVGSLHILVVIVMAFGVFIRRQGSQMAPLLLICSFARPDISNTPS